MSPRTKPSSTVVGMMLRRKSTVLVGAPVGAAGIAAAGLA
jgi:hypothetical protein